MKIKLSKKQLEKKTVSLEEFNKRFTKDELKEIESRKKYLSVLMALKDKRKEKGWSQEEVAKRAKINRITLTRLESGEGNATVNTLIKIAGAMNMGLDVKVY
jgi:DNA-binding XRE family transcriptional regulator